MRKFYIIIFLIFLPLSNVYSQDNTIVVDINYLLENSKKTLDQEYENSSKTIKDKLESAKKKTLDKI